MKKKLLKLFQRKAKKLMKITHKNKRTIVRIQLRFIYKLYAII